MRDPNRLIEGQPAPGSDEERLARLIEDVPAAATLSADAQARIAARIAELERAPRRSWLFPSLALAGAAGLAVFVWSGHRPAPQLVERPTLSAAPVARAEVFSTPGATLQVADARLVLVGQGQVRREGGVVRVEEGSISVESGAAELAVETPSARVRIAPRSRIEVTVSERAVRVAAAMGSAQVIYYDGRIELVEPVRAPEPAPIAPRHAAPSRPAPVARDAQVRVPLAADAVEPEPPTALALERASLSTALAKLRTEPKEALVLLDAHLAAHPHGALSPEAERARVAVLLRLDRRAEALTALDRMAEPPAELRVVRAELRAESGHCNEAIADFNTIALSGDDRFEERALFGRATCRQRMGDEGRMREDLERCLHRFPRGEFADRAREALSKLGRR